MTQLGVHAAGHLALSDVKLRVDHLEEVIVYL
jgi:hypothetical protein